MPDQEMVEERLRFLNIDRDAVSDIRNAKEILEPVIDEMLDRFYSHILGEPELRALFVNQDAIDHARSAQKNHWLKTLFDGKYDDTYFEKTAQIGRAHFRVGLTPNWYIGGYCHMLGQFIERIANQYADTGKPAAQIIQAVSKAIFLDMDLVIHCYLDAKDSSMRQILRRATDFTADVTTLSDDLNVTATQIKTTAETLSAQPAGRRETAPGKAGALAEHRGDTEGPINELLAQAEQLTRQTAQLNERLKELQFNDRLYIEDGIPESATLSRLKALIFGKR